MKEHKPDIAELIIKMQQQLVSLEGKVDTLIGRSPDRPVPHGYGEVKQNRDRRERTLYKAICADCKKECEVPFRPSQDRPVYCKECFSRRKTVTSFKANHDNRSGGRDIVQKRPFDKHQRGETRRPSAKKKPFPKRRKK